MSDHQPRQQFRQRECKMCGLMQRVPALARGNSASCQRCGTLLMHSRVDPIGRGVALACTGLFLIALAASLPFMQLDALGGTKGPATTLTSGPVALDGFGMWELAIVVLITTVVAPTLKLAALAWVLIGARSPNPPAHLTTVFRWVELLTPWSMIEVFMLGVFVAYTKLIDLAHVQVGGAVLALGALMLAMAAVDCVIDHEAIWRRLSRRGLDDHAPVRVGTGRSGPLVACDVCGDVSHDVLTCPRCGAALHARKPHSLQRTWALLMAAVILYIPAMTLPVMTVVQLGQGAPSTILSGVIELGAAGQWPLAALVFVASITVPVLKLFGLLTLLITTHYRKQGYLQERTRLYEIIDAVGRWSMIDVFMVSILTAVVRLGPLASITPGPGVICFCAVVILTMIAAHSFDPRLMWDAAERAPEPAQPISSKQAA